MNTPVAKQRGVVALLMVLVAIAAVGVVAIKVVSPDQVKLQAQRETRDQLKDALDSLVAWSVQHPEYPGLLPMPDRNADGDYDGVSDCPGGNLTTPVNNSHLLGRIPWQSANFGFYCDLAGMGIDTSYFRIPVTLGSSYDLAAGADDLPWIAVSTNLVYGNGSLATRFPLIDSTISASAPSAWISIFDAQGTEIADNVALVVIMPNDALAGQNHGGAAPAAANFLDSVTIGPDSFDHSSTTSFDFVQGFNSDAFNDQVAYITIDELYAKIGDRVTNELRQEVIDALDRFHTTNGEYPEFAANSADAGIGSPCTDGELSGRLPLLDDTNCEGLDDEINDIALLSGDERSNWVRRLAANVLYQRVDADNATITINNGAPENVSP